MTRTVISFQDRGHGMTTERRAMTFFVRPGDEVLACPGTCGLTMSPALPAFGRPTRDDLS